MISFDLLRIGKTDFHKLILGVKIFYAFLFLTTLAYSSAALAANSQSLADKSILIHKIANTPKISTTEKSLLLIEEFNRSFIKDFASQNFQKQKKDLNILFRVAEMLVFYTSNQDYIIYLEKAFNALKKKNMLTTKHIQIMNFSYIQLRMLEEAKKFELEFPLVKFEAQPIISQPDQIFNGMPTELVVSLNERRLFRKLVDVSQGVKVVAVVSPGCHFARAAMTAIEQSPELMHLLDGRVLWIEPQERSFFFDDTQLWNREKPFFNMKITYKSEEWPFIDQWGTPTFYILKEGKVVNEITGWPEEGRVAELIEKISASISPIATK